MICVSGAGGTLGSEVVRPHHVPVLVLTHPPALGYDVTERVPSEKATPIVLTKKL